jgi:Na+-transporting NADH:ubiquinone oxidoreductase subunit C
MVDNNIAESPVKALQIALGIALVCALLVSLTAVSLRPHYLANLDAERMARLDSILQSLGEITADLKPQDIEARVVNLETGSYSITIDADTYDARKAANDPGQSIAIPSDLDLAGIKRRATHAVVYLIREQNGNIAVLILPVRGVGYQSALYGYLALSADTSEILGLKFYQQGETPGLGSRIQDPAWEALWPGVQAFDEAGAVSIHVGSSGDRASRVDGISGATRTSMGVDRLIRFWLGETGFGLYLDRVRKGEG